VKKLALVWNLVDLYVTSENAKSKKHTDKPYRLVKRKNKQNEAALKIFIDLDLPDTK